MKFALFSDKTSVHFFRKDLNHRVSCRSEIIEEVFSAEKINLNPKSRNLQKMLPYLFWNRAYCGEAFSKREEHAFRATSQSRRRTIESRVSRSQYNHVPVKFRQLGLTGAHSCNEIRKTMFFHNRQQDWR